MTALPFVRFDQNFGKVASVSSSVLCRNQSGSSGKRALERERRGRGGSKSSFEFTDPSGTLAVPGFPLNSWIQLRSQALDESAGFGDQGNQPVRGLLQETRLCFAGLPTFTRRMICWDPLLLHFSERLAVGRSCEVKGWRFRF